MVNLHKKGTLTLEMGLWIARIIFYVIVVYSLVFFIEFFVFEDVETFDTEANLFVQRIIFSNKLNAFDEEIGRVDYGLIDLQNFTSASIENELEKEIDYGENAKISANINLKRLDEGSDYDIFYQKLLYEEKKVLTDAGLERGPGGVKSITKDTIVRIKNEDVIEIGLLTIEVIIPNS